MTSFSLNLPKNLKEQAERCADNQGVSLEMFVLLALAEKVGILSQPENDRNFPNIVYRRGASGIKQPVIRESNLRVQTLVIAHEKWELSTEEIAEDYDLTVELVQEALNFYQIYRQEIDELISSENALEAINS